MGAKSWGSAFGRVSHLPHPHCITPTRSRWGVTGGGRTYCPWLEGLCKGGAPLSWADSFKGLTMLRECSKYPHGAHRDTSGVHTRLESVSSSADGVIYNPWCLSSPAPLSNAGRWRGCSFCGANDDIQSSHLPPTPQCLPRCRMGILLLPQANQNVSKLDCGEAPVGEGRGAVLCTSVSLRLQLPASSAPHCG